MVGKIIAGVTGTAIVLLCILLYTTTPSTIGPLGILFVFILMYMSAWGVLTFLLHYGGRVVSELAIKLGISNIRNRHASLHRAYYYSSALALAPVMLIGMQSVGRVSFYDFILILLFVVIAFVYITRQIRK